mmetsp:Transcript_2387/g.8793  ORF Transcript_2387/g.8793 Transcript_2387/m.8793 type:complete len:246 (-) Transcript_2387:411-1148(-)
MGVGGGVPEAHASIRSPSARGEQPVLMRRPRDGFDGSLVLRVSQHRVGARGVPDEEVVVVAAARELAVVVRPLEAANLALMADELGDVVVRRAHVALEHVAVAAAGAQDVRRPRERPDPHAVPAHRPNLFAPPRAGVPDVQLAVVRAHRQKGAALRPRDAAHVIVRPQVAEFRHVARARAPQIHTLPQPHRQHIVRAPVHQVQVKVILKLRSVQHLERRARNLSRRTSRARERRSKSALGANRRE